MEGFSLKESLDIFVHGCIIIAKAMYILGFYTGKLVHATISWISTVLQEAKVEMRNQNWENFQFLVPITVTARIVCRPILTQIVASYHYLAQTPIDLGLNLDDLQSQYKFYSLH
jgi:hypothetical protein